MYFGKYKNEYLIHAMSISLSLFLSCFIIKTKVGSFVGMQVFLLVACIFCIYNAGYCYGCIVDHRARTEWNKNERERQAADLIGSSIGCVVMTMVLLAVVCTMSSGIVFGTLGYWFGKNKDQCREMLEKER